MHYCPQCGSPSLERVSYKEFICQQCQFTYFHNAAAAVMVAIVVNDEVLVAIRGRDPKKGMYDLPGGFVDPNESLEQAAVREIKEELGLSIYSLTYVHSYSNTYQYKTVEYKTCDCFFIVKLDQKPTVIAQDDVAEVQWVNIHNIDITQFAFTSTQQAIEQLKKQAYSRQEMVHQAQRLGGY
ncbi:NUDIX domain-containing protein [Photobacterium damselae]|uniref:NUDIX hydrolase n=1 Tax=Gammaproteobacteria TaxID=1236 RepID=UPI0023DF6504|nr:MULTISPECIES: NUDIX domain-containing protein [Gammaproteobacteria]MCG3810798.1 NUDIX domain-containing protein [Photobacterium damselae]MCG3880719.1 NUDIX domain-containing protein [Psychrobacter sp. Ps6]